MVAPKKLRLAAGVFAVSICWIPMRSMAQSGAQPAAQSGAGSKDQATQVLRGSVVYRQRIALPRHHMSAAGQMDDGIDAVQGVRPVRVRADITDRDTVAVPGFACRRSDQPALTSQIGD